jgi:hypothetical protein
MDDKVLDISENPAIISLKSIIRELEERVLILEKREKESVRGGGRSVRAISNFPPTLEEVINYCIASGYTAALGAKIHMYYSAGGWKDSMGKPVKSWKQKCISVWFPKEGAPKKERTSWME